MTVFYKTSICKKIFLQWGDLWRGKLRFWITFCDNCLKLIKSSVSISITWNGLFCRAVLNECIIVRRSKYVNTTISGLDSGMCRVTFHLGMPALHVDLIYYHLAFRDYVQKHCRYVLITILATTCITVHHHMSNRIGQNANEFH